MSKKSNPVMIGGFVVGAVVLLATGVALFGGSELFAKRYNFVAYFEEQTKGLRVGSNVVLNGVRIGYVSEIALLIDETKFETMTRVTLEIHPGTYIPIRNGAPIEEDMQEAIPHEALIRDAGLRAQLEIESFVTGQLMVRLDLRPDTLIQMSGIRSEHPEIPTIRSDIQVLLARMQEWLSNISDTVDIDVLAEGFTNALTGFAALTTSPDLHETLSGLNSIVNDADTQALSASLKSLLDELGVAVTDASDLIVRADAGMDTLESDVLPVLQQLSDTLEAAERTLQVAQLQLRGDSEQVYQLQSTLKQVEYAATALREFFDYLERNPESLIRGKRE